MEREIREKLIELARLRTTWSYSQLNDQLQLGLNFSNPLDRDLIGEWLGEISTHEYNQGRPLISALITHQNGMREQGDGFYKLCSRIFGDNWERLKADKHWENGVIAECFEYWQNPENFRNFRNDF
jgi:hypothetical protein